MFSGGSAKRSLALDRRKQINTLMIFNENVSEISFNQRYRIDFQAGELPLVMLIELPPEFPKGRPSVRIEPTGLRHPWLDATGNVIGAPGLISYSAHSDLGRVVQVIKRALERNPPVKHQPLMNGGSVTALPPQQHQPPYPPMSGYHHPGMPHFTSSAMHQPPPRPPQPQRSVITELQDLSVQDLEELKKDKRALLSFTKSLKNSEMDSLEAKIKQTRESVSKLISENKELSIRVSDKKESVEDKMRSLQSLKDHVKHLEGRVESARSQNTMTTIGDILKTECYRDEEESESCAENFLAGNSSTESFLSEYLKLRSRHHEKKAKLDDVLHTNRQLQQYGGYVQYPAPPRY